MMGDEKCSICDCKALVNHDGLMVCEECGTVQSEDMITSEFQDAVGYQSASDHKQIMKDKEKYIRPHSSSRDSDGLTLPLAKIKLYSKVFSFAPDMVERVEKMYTEIFRDPDILHTMINSKENLALACLFIEGRRTQRIFSWKEFCNITRLSVIDLNKAVKIVKTKFCIPLDTLTYTEIVANIARKHNIQKEVIVATLEILAICDKAWLVTGRNPQRLVWASIYIASRSLLIEKYRNTNLFDFLKQFDGDSGTTSTLKIRLDEILKVLKDIGETLPWALNKKKKDFVYHNLADILKHSKLVFMERTIKLKNKMATEPNDVNNEECQKRKPEAFDVSQPPAMKYRKKSPSIENEEPINKYSYCDSEDLGSDIEKELDSLIRSPIEVEEICAARQQILKDHQNGT